jgi:hypothetical protein
MHTPVALATGPLDATFARSVSGPNCEQSTKRAHGAVGNQHFGTRKSTKIGQRRQQQARCRFLKRRVILKNAPLQVKRRPTL